MCDGALYRVCALDGVLHALKHEGGSSHHVLAAAGIAPATPDRPRRFVTRAQFAAAMNAAVEDLGDESFGIKFGTHLNLGSLGAFGWLLANAPTLGATLTYLARFNHTMQQAVTVSLEVKGNRAILSHRLHGTPHQRMRHSLTGALVSYSNIIRLAAGPAWRLMAVRFPFDPPRSKEALEKTFGTDMSFGWKQAELIFDARLLARPNPERRVIDMAATEREVAETAHDLAWTDDLFILSVENIIRVTLPVCGASLPRTASLLGHHPRTLRRRLARLGLQYGDMVEAVRRERAIELLSKDDTTVSEIAELVGYTETSNFTRAFKRWTGLSPRDYLNAPY